MFGNSEYGTPEYNDNLNSEPLISYEAEIAIYIKTWFYNF